MTRAAGFVSVIESHAIADLTKVLNGADAEINRIARSAHLDDHDRAAIQRARTRINKIRNAL